MLACIACAKPELEDGGEDTARAGTPSNKDAVKSLSSQLKDMVLKFSGVYRQCKGGSATSFRSKSHHHHRYPVMDDYDADGHYTYLGPTSSTSTPAWDFTSVRNSEPGTSTDGRARAKWVLPGGSGISAAAGEKDVPLQDDGDGEPKEWIAQVEPGVHITFLSLPGGAGNDLKRIRFSREMFNKWQAQRWWGENYDRIMELYNVQKFSRQALPTPPRSDDGGEQRESFYSRTGSTRESPVTPPLGRDRLLRTGFRPPSTSSRGGGAYLPSVPDPSEYIMPHHLRPSGSSSGAVAGQVRAETSSVDASRTTTSSRDEAASISISNASDQEATEWVEQDEPGVYITIRELPDGARELRRVRFSRERFGEVHAKLWWEENRERIQAQYL
ncbi:protein BREVIS RADIX [Dendrobium catenatum]|uniref:Protein BREVIS RADIX n=1 Tax=Dendrobium catenatum TaxID=906689 RepID=A0A2I0VUJ0_9ASPA|nr:protein BREVIS RADIX [Dendrobium catenatum]PKU67077.1 Protein BREVIS RADIX [Dendrobium catenatum]